MPPRAAKKTPTSSVKKQSPKITSEEETIPVVPMDSLEPEEVPVAEAEKIDELKSEEEEEDEEDDDDDEEEEEEEEANGEVQENGEAQADTDSEPEEEEDVQVGEDDESSAEEADDGDGESGQSGSDDDEEDEPGEGDEDEEDPSIYMHAPLKEGKPESEIFVGGLSKEAVEEDLVKVFGEFGEILSTRIAKHPVTQKSKGFGFILYATAEQAKKAITNLNELEVKGKKVRISASENNRTLYVGNICKTWTKAKVLETLKGYGVDHIEEMLLPDDPKVDGQSKGFAILEFTSHPDAMTAFQQLRKPDAIFGCDFSAKVAFTQSSMHLSEETLSQVKTVYVEGLPASWDEEKINEHCKQYGEIEKVELSRNFASAKKKDYGFIAFTTRESALACVEGINKLEIGEGDSKVKANIAKRQNRGWLGKQRARGAFRVKKDGDSTGASRQGRSKSKGKGKGVEARGRSRSKSIVATASKKQKTETLKKEQMDAPLKKASADRKNKHGGRVEDANYSRPLPKKFRDNRTARGRPSKGFGKRGSPWVARHQQASYPARPAPYKRRHSDLEPHAGFLEPAAKQTRAPIGYGQSRRRSVGYESQRSAGSYGVAHSQSYVSDYPAYPGYEASYGYSRVSGYPRRSGYY